jgi:hypothetical protein
MTIVTRRGACDARLRVIAYIRFPISMPILQAQWLGPERAVQPFSFLSLVVHLHVRAALLAAAPTNLTAPQPGIRRQAAAPPRHERRARSLVVVVVVSLLCGPMPATAIGPLN